MFVFVFVMFKVPAHSMLDKIDDSKLGEKIVDAKTKSDLNICFNVGQDDIDTNMKNNNKKGFDFIQKSKTTLAPVENPETCKFEIFLLYCNKLHLKLIIYYLFYF